MKKPSQVILQCKKQEWLIVIILLVYKIFYANAVIIKYPASLCQWIHMTMRLQQWTGLIIIINFSLLIRSSTPAASTDKSEHSAGLCLEEWTWTITTILTCWWEPMTQVTRCTWEQLQWLTWLHPSPLEWAASRLTWRIFSVLCETEPEYHVYPCPYLSSTQALEYPTTWTSTLNTTWIQRRRIRRECSFFNKRDRHPWPGLSPCVRTESSRIVSRFTSSAPRSTTSWRVLRYRWSTVCQSQARVELSLVWLLFWLMVITWSLTVSTFRKSAALTASACQTSPFRHKSKCLLIHDDFTGNSSDSCYVIK